MYFSKNSYAQFYSRRFVLFYIKFIFSILFVVATIFSEDYYPLKVGNYWTSFGRLPLSPMSTCPGDTNHFPMSKVDSAVQIQNATVYIINDYAADGNDICQIRANSVYLLDSGNAIYYIDRYPNPAEKNCIGFHNYKQISNWVDFYGDTIVADYIGDTIIENISFNSCYSVHEKTNAFCVIYAENIGPVASFVDGELDYLLKDYGPLSTGAISVKKECQGTAINTKDYKYNLLGRKYKTGYSSMSVNVINNKLTITKPKRLK